MLYKMTDSEKFSKILLACNVIWSPFTTFLCRQPHIERTQLFSGHAGPVKFARFNKQAHSVFYNWVSKKC